MSIVKNNKVSYNKDFTIRRLPKGVAVTVGNGSYIFKKYVQANNVYFDAPWYLAAGETVYIKAEIEQNATGYIYGHNRNTTGTSGGHSIRKNGSNIEWLNGDAVVASTPWSAGVHIYGFAGEMSGTIGCKPSYDGEIIADTIISGGGKAENARIGGLLEGTMSSTTDHEYCIHSTGTWAIRIYEVYAYSYSQYTSQPKYPRVYHCYAATSTDGSAIYLVDTRYALSKASPVNGSAVTGVTRSYSAVDFDGEGYGIQLSDLREMTGSSYTQLLAILTEDDPLKTLPNASDPFVINNRNFAFKLKNVPAGATGSLASEDGDLIKGRRPKWNIWNDAIKFGMYVSGTPKKMRFNIFRDNCGDDISSATHKSRYGSTDLVGVFEGYDTSANHEPYINIVDGDLTAHIHNGAFVRCSGLEVLAGKPGYEYTKVINGGTQTAKDTIKDQEAIYMLNTNAGGSIKYCPGNLIPWNYTRTQCEQWLGWLALGCKLKVNLAVGSSEEEYLASEHTVGAPYLNADTTDTSIKNQYRSTGFTDSLDVTKNKWYLLDHFVADSLPMKASLTLIGDTGEIDCGDLLEKKDVSLTAVRDGMIQTGSNKFRMIVDCAEDIGVIGTTTGAWPITSLHSSTSYTPNKSAIAFPIIGCSKTTYSETASYPDGTSKKVYRWNPVYSDKDYISVIELYYTTTVSRQTRYNAAVAVKDAIRGMTAFDASHRWMLGEVWGDSNVPGSRAKSVWRECVSNIKNEGSNISNLATYSRVVVAENTDFFGSTGASMIPDDATAIAHIYDKSTAPIFGGLYGYNTWDNQHHVNAAHFTGRHIAFTKLYYVSNELNKMKFTCLAYDSSYNLSTFVPGACEMYVYVNGTLRGTAYIEDYNYKPSGMNGETYHNETYYGVSGSTRTFTASIRNNDAPDELIYGLNDVYWRGSYFGIEITFTQALNKGDFVTIDFRNAG